MEYCSCVGSIFYGVILLLFLPKVVERKFFSVCPCCFLTSKEKCPSSGSSTITLESLCCSPELSLIDSVYLESLGRESKGPELSFIKEEFEKGL